MEAKYQGLYSSGCSPRYKGLARIGYNCGVREAKAEGGEIGVFLNSVAVGGIVK
jgi:hypothetical protein